MIVTQSKTKQEERTRSLPILSLSIPATTEKVFSAYQVSKIEITRSELCGAATSQPLTPPFSSPSKSTPPSSPEPQQQPLSPPASASKTESEHSIREPCFQCFHQGLRCSFSSTHQRRIPPHQHEKRSCSRCKRNNEAFCILQDAEVDDRGNVMNVTYEAPGVQPHLVLRRVQDLQELRWFSWRWALPFASPERRQALRSVREMRVA